jgi:3-methyladenine DNA glycosylase AlkD/TfoX/Sxy family transcriptional regulator of competence genes
MGSSKDFVEFICDQIRDAGDISFRKMFGEYALYCDGKMAALICDDQVFVKKTEAAAAVLGENAEEAPPYEGAKQYFLIADPDDQRLMTRLIRSICDVLPPPKPKKAKAAKTKTAAGSIRKQTATHSLALSQTAAHMTDEFLSRKDDAQAAQLMRFFKTGPGQYGEGDRFLGIKVPVTRSLVKSFLGVARLSDCDELLDSEWHEIRLAAFLLMAGMAKRLAKQDDKAGLHKLVKLYDRRLERANNWDLIDLSVRDIMGFSWRCNGTGARERRRFLKNWADSGNLWRERAAMVATWSLLRMGSLGETFWLAERFIDHRHDLMHKAVGWMLREAGAIDRGALRDFLAAFHQRLPRTALRYAIEHMDPEERRGWMEK